MENEKKAAKKISWASFMAWYESYQGKHVTGIVYSLGASVVIIGALFKILHWPGANQTLMMGMFTEAFLFAIGCLDKPHMDFHWDEVFPQIADPATEPKHYAELQTRPRPTLLGAGGGNGSAPSIPGVDEKVMDSLKSGISDLAKTAGQLSELTKVATATAKLGEKAEAAADAAEKYAAATEKYANAATELGKNSEAMNKTMAAAAKNVEGAVEGSKLFGESMIAAGKNCGNLGEDVKKLAKQVSDLNAIYGNMLNAVA